MEKPIDFRKSLNKLNKYISKLSDQQKEKLLELLLKVQNIQKSNMTTMEKTAEIKRILWKEQSPKSKLFIGGFLGTLAGLFIFGTGGIGIAGLGSAIGVWGFLAGTVGGVLVSSLIQNFEKKGILPLNLSQDHT